MTPCRSDGSLTRGNSFTVRQYRIFAAVECFFANNLLNEDGGTHEILMCPLQKQMLYTSTIINVDRTCNQPPCVRDVEQHHAWIRVTHASRSYGR